MLWGQVLVMAVTTLDGIVRNPFLSLKILDSFQTLSPFGATFHPKSSKRKGNWKFKITHVIAFLHVCTLSLTRSLFFIYHTWAAQRQQKSKFTFPIPKVVLRAVRPTSFWKARESGWNKKILLVSFFMMLQTCGHPRKCTVWLKSI